VTSQDVLKKVKKLLRHADSAEELGSEKEAEIFASKAEELLARHKLSMSDVEWVELDDTDPIGRERVDPAEHDGLGKRRKQRRGWQEHLAQAVAEAHFCKIIVHPGSNVVTFVGRESDREVAIYVYVRLMDAALRLAKRDYRKARREGKETKGFLTAWWHAYVATIRRRYRKQKQEREERLRNEDRSTALVRLKDALTVVEEHMSEEYNLSKASGVGGTKMSNRHGYAKGAEAGQNANLSGDGLEGANGSQGQLTS
jgi:hypothetical protein